MNTEKFSDAMSKLDSKYINEAISYAADRREGATRGASRSDFNCTESNAADRREGATRGASRSTTNHRFPVALVATVLILILGGCMAIAASVFGTQLIDFFTSESESGTDFEQSGYDLAVFIEKIPVNDFSDEIQEVGDIIKQQFRDYKEYDSWYPGHWQSEFSSRDKACEYIGFDSLKQLDWNLEEVTTTLNVYGNEKGEILSVNIETSYIEGDMNVQFFSQIYTENYDEEITLGIRTTESVEFEESFLTTDNSKQCHIISSSALESGYMGLDGYIVDEGVLYRLHIAYKEKDSAQAMELMHKWANMF